MKEELFIEKLLFDAKSENDIKFDLSNDVIQRAIKYTKFRTDWFYYNLEEKKNNDSYRTSSHNAFIDSLNIYIRNIYKELEFTKDMDRKQLGDLANKIVCSVAISQR